MGQGIRDRERGRMAAGSNAEPLPLRAARCRLSLYRKEPLNAKILISLTAVAALAGCVSAPQLECSTPRVVYSEAAKAQGAHGTVKVRIGVSETGSAKSLYLVQSSGYPMLDQAALDSARAASCTPYHPSMGGDATAGTALVTYHFDLVR